MVEIGPYNHCSFSVMDDLVNEQVKVRANVVVFMWCAKFIVFFYWK